MVPPQLCEVPPPPAKEAHSRVSTALERVLFPPMPEMAQNGDIWSQQPLRGVVLCCTSIPQDVRTSLAETALAMGALHKLDLTSDVTHLVVGDINTPKYRYTAKDRPDIKVVLPEFIEALRAKWMADEDVDVEALEKEHAVPIFMHQKVCITGFETNEERKSIEELVVGQGGEYHADLTKEATHLVVAKCQGAKYTYAKQWGIRLVSHRWLTDSLQRGMALDESSYGPELPSEQQGVGAFKRLHARTSLGKRKSEVGVDAAHDEGGKRKLRKVASARLDAHSQELWQDMSAQEVPREKSDITTWDDDGPTLGQAPPLAVTLKPATKYAVPPFDGPQGLFAGHYILIHGFDDGKVQLLRNILESNGAIIVTSPDKLEAASTHVFFRNRCLLVPHARQDSPADAPEVPPATLLATEWWVERCIHYKRYVDPSSDALSQPLGRAGVSGVAGLVISTTGFTGVSLRQTAEAVKLTGARYQETLLPSTSVLVCGASSVKREKALYASKHRIPVVTDEWLWAALTSRTKVPYERYKLSLPTFDAAEMAGSSSAGSPAPSDAGGKAEREAKRPSHGQAKRLTNVRKHHTTHALQLEASHAVAPSTRRGPFVYEDEDADPGVSLDSGPDLATARRKTSASHSGPPLREISPNASPQKLCSTWFPGKDAPDQVQRAPEPVGIASHRSPSNPTHSRTESDVLGPSMPSHEQAALDLVGIMERRKAQSDLTNPSEPLKRRSRPLGRNLSGISNRSGSASARAELAPAALRGEDSNATADGFQPSHETEDPPSTQLGYENPEAEAHRLQMSKRLGTKAVADDETGVGRHVVSAGTVKDYGGGPGTRRRERAAAAAAAMGGGRTKVRQR